MYPVDSGIWRFLPPDRRAVYARFLAEYGAIRSDQGWGSQNAEYYRTLPVSGPDDPQRGIWRLRERSLATLLQRVVTPRAESAGRPLRAIDIGAGNCWLSHRLAALGHHLAAVDIADGNADGLGAHIRYDLTRLPGSLTPVQAEMDRLPFGPEQFDLAIFNASLHYSDDCEVSLREALRVLRPEGAVIVLDTPVYSDPASGTAMLRERREAFQSRYGYPSDSLPMEGFLTAGRLAALASRLSLTWTAHHAPAGFRQRLQPLRARLLRRREPARMPVLAGTVAPRTDS